MIAAARGGQGARRRVPQPLVALAGHAERRHRRPHLRHRARSARSPPQGAARGRGRDRRGRSRPDLGPDRRVARPAGVGRRLRDLRVDERAVPVAVGAGRRGVLARRVDHPLHRRRRHRRRARPGRAVQGMDAGRLGAAEKIYIGLRGSYSGVLMAGLATSLVGLTLINPLSLLVGVLVGRRAYREDKTARLSPASGRGQEPRAPAHRGRRVPGGQAAQGSTPTRAARRARPLRRASPTSCTARCPSRSWRRSRPRRPTTSDRDGRVIELQAQLARIEALRAEIPAIRSDDRTSTGAAER